MTCGLLGRSEKEGASSSKKKRNSDSAIPATTLPQPPPQPRSAKPKRELQVVEITTPRLYVGNLDFKATEEHLEELFKGVGTVASVEIVANPQTHQSKGFGFVEMNHIDEARRAVDVLHDQDFMGRRLQITGAKNEEENENKDETPSPAPAAEAPSSGDELEVEADSNAAA